MVRSVRVIVERAMMRGWRQSSLMMMIMRVVLVMGRVVWMVRVVGRMW